MIGEIGWGLRRRKQRLNSVKEAHDQTCRQLYRRTNSTAGQKDGTCRSDHLRWTRNSGQKKIEALEAAGIAVAESPATIGDMLVRRLEKRG